jgi:hypothetical protein
MSPLARAAAAAAESTPLPMSRDERKFRARVAEILLVVVTSSECGEELKAYVIEAGRELGLIQVGP